MSAGAAELEPHWGDPERAQVRRGAGRGEIAAAMGWLAAATLAGLVLEVVYLAARVDVAGVSLPVPWTIPVAYLVNLVASRTALLWTGRRAVAAVPLAAWIAGFLVLLLWSAAPFGADVVLGPWLRTIALLVAGVAGGGWPLRHG
ncbi:hypothetical protein [Corynebacterium sphenisci]|uniref:hypothetical protein n=1 Tax=Corynebacterium sphenisci TaxID=191493 RepID=UPI0009515A79|nr:hypothetical protein [Corynebacterium sphenisci]